MQIIEWHGVSTKRLRLFFPSGYRVISLRREWDALIKVWFLLHVEHESELDSGENVHSSRSDNDLPTSHWIIVGSS